MRNTREILRQKWLLERSHRAVCASVGVSMGTVSQALKRAAGAKLTWEAVEAIDDDELEARLYPSVVAAGARAEPGRLGASTCFRVPCRPRIRACRTFRAAPWP